MAQRLSIVVSVLVVSCLLAEVNSRPAENGNAVLIGKRAATEADHTSDPEIRAYPYYTSKETSRDTENTQEILEKINKLNQGLTKPQRQQMNHNKPDTDKGYVLDEETLKKLQFLISTGKLQLVTETPQFQETSDNTNLLRNGSPRALAFRQGVAQPSPLVSQPTNLALVPTSYAVVPLPDTTMPYGNQLYGAYNSAANNDLNTVENPYLTKQGLPSLPFQLQWPLAQYFPILVKDPLITYLQGGNLNNWVEYGQNADVCRKQKSSHTHHNEEEDGNDIIKYSDEEEVKDIKSKLVRTNKPRQGRAIKKRNISQTASQQLTNTKRSKLTNKIVRNKTKYKKKIAQPVYQEEEEVEIEEPKHPDDDEGDLRTPFSDFNWFGNRKPVAPSPGFFINRLKVRRGGVAIAGPGGVATAGRGGTAIVGPGGLAYTQPGGMAVAGPHARVFALPPHADLSQIVAQLQKNTNDGTVPRHLPAIGGKLVATGPVIYYHDLQN